MFEVSKTKAWERRKQKTGQSTHEKGKNISKTKLIYAKELCSVKFSLRGKCSELS